jgi:hypothetical protein
MGHWEDPARRRRRVHVASPAAKARSWDDADLSGPMAKDMPYTPYTDGTLRRLAALQPRTVGLMHGSTFRGDGAHAILDLAAVIRDTLGKSEAEREG